MAVFRSTSGSFKALQVTGSDLTIISSSVYIKNLTTASQLNIITIDTASGQLYYTASSAIGGGGGGDITDVTAGNGLSGGGSSGNVTVTLDTSSTHFVSGVSKLTGSLLTTSSFNSWTGSSTSQFSGTASYVSGSVFTSTNPALSASYALTASYASNVASTFPFNGNAVITGSLLVSGGNSGFSGITGSFTGSLVGSLTGTASWASSASNAINSQTSSFLPVGTYQITSSWAQSASQALTASFVQNAQTASFLPVGTYQITSSWAQSASNAINSQTASFLPVGTYNITASWAQSASQALTASFVTTAQTASYVTGSIFTSANPVLSASYALTASHALNNGGVTINNNTDNYLITATGTANTLDGEANLTFDGSVLTVSGSLINNGSFNNNISYNEFDTLLAEATSNGEGYNSFSGEVLLYQSGLPGFNIDAGVSLGDLIYLKEDGIWYQVDQTNNTSTKKLGFYVRKGSNYGILTNGYMVLDENKISNANYGRSVFITGSVPVTYETNIANITSGYIRNIGHLHYNENNNYPGWWVLKFNPSNDWSQII